MDEFNFKRSHVPAFGSWDCNGDLPFTQCFESARQAGLLRCSYTEERDLYVAGDLYENDVFTPAMIVVPRHRIGPLRELAMKGLDQVKLRRATVLTIGGTVFVILLSDLFSILKIQNKGTKHGAMTPMDQVIWRTNLLEATLMGLSLFLGFLIDRMDHYMRKLIKLRSSTGVSAQEVERLEREKLQLKENAEKAAGEVKQLQREISSLTENLKKMKMETMRKGDLVDNAEAHVVALQKQAADLLLEYDRLLEDNQILQNQVFGYHS